MAQNTTSTKRPKLAAITTAWKRIFHPPQVVDRLLDGYGWNGTYYHPNVDVVSLYVDQRGPGDIFQDRVDRHPTMKIYPTIAEALTLGHRQAGSRWSGRGGRTRRVSHEPDGHHDASAL